MNYAELEFLFSNDINFRFFPALRDTPNGASSSLNFVLLQSRQSSTVKPRGINPGRIPGKRKFCATYSTIRQKSAPNLFRFRIKLTLKDCIIFDHKLEATQRHKLAGQHSVHYGNQTLWLAESGEFYRISNSIENILRIKKFIIFKH